MYIFVSKKHAQSQETNARARFTEFCSRFILLTLNKSLPAEKKFLTYKLTDNNYFPPVQTCSKSEK